MDIITAEKRSVLMSKIRSKDTKPEVKVRSILHRLGYRFRIHRADLPGKPDIILPKYKAAILVHGCFWHGHECKIASKPKSNQSYWHPKIEVNRARDERNAYALTGQGWKVLTLWECEIRKGEGLEEKIENFLNGNSDI
jgi:DNA mismatch endonuclease (patch repair protein)